jgi:ubiquinone/menaquinone biosynthesis C-methylase UbiE
MFFLRKTKRQEDLPVAMSGVRMGERALQIGVDDPALLGALASKVGLSGHAAIAVSDEAAAAIARGAAEKAGALVDLHVSPLHSLPIADNAFDVVVLHAKSGWFAALDSVSRVAVLGEAYRVLRGGGRLVAIEGASGTAVDALPLAGFKAARILADREGYRFAEGLKPRS